MKTTWFKPALFLFVTFVAMTSCTKKAADVGSNAAVLGPEDTIRRFVNLSAGAKNDSDRDQLLELCQGELRRAFERMSKEAFKVSYLTNEIQLKEVKILESSVTGKNAKVVYQVTLENKQGTDTTEEINTREVELVQVGNAWLIENIKAKGSDTIAFTRGMIF